MSENTKETISHEKEGVYRNMEEFYTEWYGPEPLTVMTSLTVSFWRA
jgi:hypothetical protein